MTRRRFAAILAASMIATAAPFCLDVAIAQARPADLYDVEATGQAYDAAQESYSASSTFPDLPAYRRAVWAFGRFALVTTAHDAGQAMPTGVTCQFVVHHREINRYRQGRATRALCGSANLPTEVIVKTWEDGASRVVAYLSAATHDGGQS